MKYFITVPTICLIVILGAGCLADVDFAVTESSVQFDNEKETTFNVFVADGPVERTLGLGGTAKLEGNEGMIFLYDEADTYEFWMKEVNYPLDIIWLNDLEVVDITENVQPEDIATPDSDYRHYAPVVPANAVLEVNAGVVERQDIQIGDTVMIKLFTT